jgi:hypothetical protein
MVRVFQNSVGFEIGFGAVFPSMVFPECPGSIILIVPDGFYGKTSIGGG